MEIVQGVERAHLVQCPAIKLLGLPLGHAAADTDVTEGQTANCSAVQNTSGARSRAYRSLLLHMAINGTSWPRCEGFSPVLPCLHAIAVQQEVKRLPVVVDLITVVDDIVQGAQQARHEQAQQNGAGAGLLALQGPSWT